MLHPSSRGSPGQEKGVGLREVLGVVTMHLFVREYHTMIAAPVQRDVGGIPEGSHSVVAPVGVHLGGTVIPAPALAATATAASMSSTRT
jgi:hypothetical protein